MEKDEATLLRLFFALPLLKSKKNTRSTMADGGHNRHDEGIFNQLNRGAAGEERIVAPFKPFSMTA